MPRPRRIKKHCRYAIPEGVTYVEAREIGMHCFYCGVRMQKRKRGPDGKVVYHSNTRTVEHVQPLGRGGTNSADNKVFACYKCNMAKKTMTLEEFRLFIYKNPHIEFAGETLGRQLAQRTASSIGRAPDS
jgi:hypothetical protein